MKIQVDNIRLRAGREGLKYTLFRRYNWCLMNMESTLLNGPYVSCGGGLG